MLVSAQATKYKTAIPVIKKHVKSGLFPLRDTGRYDLQRRRCVALINTGVEPLQAGGAVRGRKGPLGAYKEPSEAGVAPLWR